MKAHVQKAIDNIKADFISRLKSLSPEECEESYEAVQQLIEVVKTGNVELKGDSEEVEILYEKLVKINNELQDENETLKAKFQMNESVFGLMNEKLDEIGLRSTRIERLTDNVLSQLKVNA